METHKAIRIDPTENGGYIVRLAADTSATTAFDSSKTNVFANLTALLNWLEQVHFATPA